VRGFLLGLSVLTAAGTIVFAFAAGADRLGAVLPRWAWLRWWQRGLLVLLWFGYFTLMVGALVIVDRGSRSYGLGPLFSDDADD
jgi:hypothetical protein